MALPTRGLSSGPSLLSASHCSRATFCSFTVIASRFLGVLKSLPGNSLLVLQVLPVTVFPDHPPITLFTALITESLVCSLAPGVWG